MKTLGPVVGFALVVTVYFYPVVFGGRSLLTSPMLPGTLPSGPYGAEVLRDRMPRGGILLDAGSSAWTMEPWTVLVGRMYRNGEIPLWNPYSGFGMPLAANIQSGAFFPPRLPVFLFPTAIMWNAYLLLRFVLIALFMYRFLRLWAWSRASSFGGSLVFTFSGYFVLYANMWHLDVEMLIPVAMVCAERLIRRRSRGSAAALGLVLALTILGGSPESTIFLWLFVGAYYAFRTVAIALRLGDGRRAAFAYGGPFVASVGVGIIVASPVLVLAWQYLAQAHAPIHEAGGKTGLGGLSWTGAVSLAVPYMFDHLTNPIVPGLGQLTPYVGAVPIALSLLTPARRLTWFFGLYAAVSVLKGYALPGLNLLGALPILDRLIFPKYNQPVVAFCVAVLVAATLERLSTGLPRPLSPPRAWVTGGLVLATIAGFVSLHQCTITGAGRWGWVLWQVAVAGLVLAAAIALFVWADQRRPAGSLVSAGCIALLALELFWYVPKQLPPRMDASARAPFVDFVRRDDDVFRVYGLDSALYPDTNVVHELSDIRALDAIYPPGYLSLVRKSLDASAHDRFIGGTLEEVIRHRALLDLMNVKYLVGYRPVSSPVSESLTEAILKDGERQGPKGFFGRTSYSIEGSVKEILFLHSTAQLTYPFRVPGEGGTLRFAVAMDPAVWDPAKGDGVRYRMDLVVEGHTSTVFDQYIDPKHRAQDRRWHEAAVDLTAYRGKNIRMVLVAEPGQTHVWDSGGWGDLRLERRETVREKVEGVEKVYDREVQVYRNARVLPRAYVVHEAKVIADEQRAVAELTAASFEPRRSVILGESVPHDVAFRPGTGTNDLARIEHYSAHRIVVAASVEAPGFLVLSDTFYPGWRATVDGRDAKIYRANVLFRAVALDPGTHHVEFSYHPPAGFSLASVLSVVVLVGAIGVIWHGRRTAR